MRVEPVSASFPCLHGMRPESLLKNAGSQVRSLARQLFGALGLQSQGTSTNVEVHSSNFSLIRTSGFELRTSKLLYWIGEIGETPPLGGANICASVGGVVGFVFCQIVIVVLTAKARAPVVPGPTGVAVP